MSVTVGRFRPIVSRQLRAAMQLALVVAIPVAHSATAGAQLQQLQRSLPAALSDREFWELFESASETGGSFPSDNFVSNEMGFQTVIPTLQRTTTPGGVYLGVGPEQNFTYIVNLKPKMAIIFDIRRQNAMAHLMYKALFEMSPTRADFVSKLFSRPLPRTLAADAPPKEIFDLATDAMASDSAYRANLDAIVTSLTKKHNFALTPEDVRSIEKVYGAFFAAGPLISYNFRPTTNGFPFTGGGMATYAALQTATNADSVNMAFLATEVNYQWLKALHAKNLVVPVVGDFAGPKAIRTVADYLKQRRAKVMAFYLSNVEQYLFQQGDNSTRFYRNVETLPLDSTSTFIRSVPLGGGAMAGARLVTMSGGFTGGNIVLNGFGNVMGGPGTTFYSQTRYDSAGLRVTRTIQDSAGVRVTRTTLDSAGRITTTTTVDSTGRFASAGFGTYSLRTDSLRRFLVDSVGRMRLGGGVVMISPDSLRLRVDSLRRLYPATPVAVPPVPPTPARYSIVTGGSGLASGIASITETIKALNDGKLLTYQDVIAITKTSGWK
jgi:hypothetical protein